MSYKPTVKQQEAWALVGGPAKNVMLAGGSRSGKTFINCRAVSFRAIASPKSRHAIMRFRFNAVKASIVLDTFPKMMELCFPSVDYEINKTDWYATLQNDSQIWFGGLDDKDRTEKILGQEYATIFFNECSQIPFASVNTALTRLAQMSMAEVEGERRTLRLKALYDENPPSQAHWTYKQFVKKVEPETGKPLPNPQDYAMMYLNPADNLANLPADYLSTLDSLPSRMRDRFKAGKFQDITEGALWNTETIDRFRVNDPPEMQRIVVAVDPSGSGDEDNAGNDEIGIVVVGLGMDGNAHILEDLTCKAGPATWGKAATNAYERHAADLIVGEKNFGGEMVRFVIQTARPNTPFKFVTASRGKVVRAEPVAALCENGKMRFAGSFNKLEDELCSFTTNGYIGSNSPNRADAAIWGVSELFPSITREKRKTIDMTKPDTRFSQHDWMR